MEHKDKLDWLKWAVAKDMLHESPGTFGGYNLATYFDYSYNDLGPVAALHTEDTQVTLFCELETFIRDEIDNRDWFLTQQDIREGTGKRFRARIELRSGSQIAGQFANDRLEALMLAFREAVEANG